MEHMVTQIFFKNHCTVFYGGYTNYIPRGDMIEIDIINHRIELLVSDEELEERRKNFKPKLPVVKGYLKKYASMVTSANTGAVLKVKE